MAREKRCWYCGIPLSRREGSPDFRTTEHLVARANGGIDDRRNLRLACARCNSFVGSWPLDDKLKFRAMIREAHGWPGVRRRFGPRAGFAWRVRCALARMESPRDAVSARAREALEAHRRSAVAAEPPSPAQAQRVLIDASPYLEAGLVGPEDEQIAAWRFEIAGEIWQAPVRIYRRARRTAVAMAVKAGVAVVRVLVPG